MPAAWKLYNRAIRKLGAGTIVLPGAVRCALYNSTAAGSGGFPSRTHSLHSQIVGEVANGTVGYTTLGKALANEVWTAAGAASAGQIKFDADDPIWTATGGTIKSIMGAVLIMSGASAGVRHAFAFASLTSNIFALQPGNTLRLQFNTAGIFTAANA